MTKVYLNGAFIDEARASVPVSDRGLLYGDGLFETMRAYNGKVFRLPSHVHRLKRSAEALRMPMKHSSDEIAGAVDELLRINGLGDAYVRITLTRGRHAGDLGLDTNEPPTLFITAREYRGYPEDLYRGGMKLTVASSVRDSRSTVGRHKTLNYLENLIARDAAKRKGFDEALFLDENGCIAECATSNLFFVKDEVLFTPSTEMNILPGITREIVMEIVREDGGANIPVCALPGKQEAPPPKRLRRSREGGCLPHHDVFESWYPLDNLLAADEAFLTNSLMEIMPVASIDKRNIGTTPPGPITRRIAEEYKRLAAPES